MTYGRFHQMEMKMFLATYIPHHMTYVAELARKGCRKINYSAMSATGREGDQLVSPRLVPLEIRRAAKSILLGL